MHNCTIHKLNAKRLSAMKRLTFKFEPLYPATYRNAAEKQNFSHGNKLRQVRSSPSKGAERGHFAAVAFDPSRPQYDSKTKWWL